MAVWMCWLVGGEHQQFIRQNLLSPSEKKLRNFEVLKVENIDDKDNLQDDNYFGKLLLPLYWKYHWIALTQTLCFTIDPPSTRSTPIDRSINQSNTLVVWSTGDENKEELLRLANVSWRSVPEASWMVKLNLHLPSDEDHLETICYSTKMVKTTI